MKAIEMLGLTLLCIVLMALSGLMWQCGFDALHNRAHTSVEARQ